MAAVSAMILCTVGASRSAAAYCRTTTCDDCTQPANGCVTLGKPLYWAGNCVSYDLQRDASRSVSLQDATRIVERSFLRWQQATCTATGATPSIAFLDRGPVECGAVEYNDPDAQQSPRSGGNANIIVFRDEDWESTSSSEPTSTLALTTVTFSKGSGEIFDADIEVNATKELSAADAAASDKYDLDSILTHEIGHFLGLAHSRESCAGVSCPTMFAQYMKGSTEFRTLELDDVVGVCSIYPPGQSAAGSNCVPMHGFGSECGKPTVPSRRCSVSAIASASSNTNTEGHTWWCVAAVALAVSVVRRRHGNRATERSSAR